MSDYDVPRSAAGGIRISPSLLQTWAVCPLQAKFKTLDKLPAPQSAAATFGSIIHLVLEELVWDDDLKAAEKRFLYLWDNPEAIDLSPDYWPRGWTWQGKKKEGIQIIKRYHESRKWIKTKVLATEHKFVVPCGRHDISGIVDLLEIGKKGSRRVLRIVDHKTGKVPYPLWTLRYNIQFSVYAYASYQPEFWMGDGTGETKPIPGGAKMFDQFQNLPRVTVWNSLKNGREYETGSRTQKDFERLHMAIDEIEKAIENNVFVPNISADSCGICDFQEPCGLEIP